MLPEPTARKRAARPARPQPGGMTPLFSVPGSGEPDDEIPASGRGLGSRVPRGAREPRGSTASGRARRANSRPSANPPIPASRVSRNGIAGKASPHLDAGELLAVTAERLRRSLARSFLRYGMATDLEAAVHAAMNVVEPVLEARDTEILRLRLLMAGKIPGKLSGR
jgi:hypothetical protein